MTPVIAFVIGASLGLFYFGGLWLTLQQLPVTQHPYRLISLSFIFRLGITLLVVSLILSSNSVYGVVPLLICCLGFLAVRTSLILLIQPPNKVNSILLKNH